VTLPRDGQLLRIFIGESDRWGGQPLYEAIVQEARKRGLAGARCSRLRGVRRPQPGPTRRAFLRLSEDLPIVVRSWTRREDPGVLPFLDEMMKDGLATVEKHRHLLPSGRTPRKTRAASERFIRDRALGERECARGGALVGLYPPT